MVLDRNDRALRISLEPESSPLHAPVRLRHFEPPPSGHPAPSVGGQGGVEGPDLGTAPPLDGVVRQIERPYQLGRLEDHFAHLHQSGTNLGGIGAAESAAMGKAIEVVGREPAALEGAEVAGIGQRYPQLDPSKVGRIGALNINPPHRPDGAAIEREIQLGELQGKLPHRGGEQAVDFRLAPIDRGQAGQSQSKDEQGAECDASPIAAVHFQTPLERREDAKTRRREDAKGAKDAKRGAEDAAPAAYVSTRYVGRSGFVSVCLIRSSALSNLTTTLQGSAVGKSNPLAGLDVGLRGRLRRPGAAPSYCSE